MVKRERKGGFVVLDRGSAADQTDAFAISIYVCKLN